MPKHGGIATVNADETLLGGTFTEAPLSTNAPAVAAPATAAQGRPLDQPVIKGQVMENRLAAHIPMANVHDQYRHRRTQAEHQQRRIGRREQQVVQPIRCSVQYRHEGRWHKVDRTWTIRTDGSGLTKIHTRIMAMEIFGHEF